MSLPLLPRRACRGSLFFAGGLLALAGARTDARAQASAAALKGDWDYYQTMGATPTGGWEARRRFAFVHLEGTDTAGSWWKDRPRRSRTPSRTIRATRRPTWWMLASWS